MRRALFRSVILATLGVWGWVFLGCLSVVPVPVALAGMGLTVGAWVWWVGRISLARSTGAR
ncbi:MAG TPA: hypothetical protein VNM37_12065 [Candidatus Dormibacteraeota bacterium]|nr:hypothetical protein [Candidatus Dormibacteraeota bacterium]